jgi:hypothetical protein
MSREVLHAIEFGSVKIRQGTRKESGKRDLSVEQKDMFTDIR